MRSISASKCISKLTWSQPRSVSLTLHDYVLQACTITASKCIANLARPQPPSVSPNSLNYGLPTCSITASECISKFNRSPCGETMELKADWPSWTLRRTSLGIRWEFVRKRSSSSRSVERGWDMLGHLAKMNHTNCVDLWTLSKSAWRSTKIV